MIPLTAAILFAVAFFSLKVHGTVYVTDNAQRKVIELRGRSQPCLIYTDRDVVDKMLHNSGIRYLQKMSLNDLDSLGFSCRDMDQINKRGGFIYPGTRWCGPGNIASSYNDLGSLTEEDKCCREHDHCPNQLEPGQCRQGICNISPFTRSHCDCDHSFKRCLRNVNSDAANTIGTLFFNIVQVTCFKDRRTCPQYMRDDPSYTWFCEEWKFEPSEEFNNSLLTRQPADDGHAKIPNKITDFKPRLHSSNIDKNLQNLYEIDPNAGKIMMSKGEISDKQPPSKHAPSILNRIENGKKIWRD